MADYRVYARKAAGRVEIDQDYFERQIQQESDFNPRAFNRASGASGIAQIIPRFHPTVDPWSPEAALDYAAGLDATWRRQFGNSYVRAFAAYNWGPGNVVRWDGRRDTLPAETRHYLDVILGPDWARTGDGPPPAGCRVRGTDGAGLNLRKQPRVGAEVVKLLPEGADVQPRDRAWRTVRDPADGSAGWVADQFLVPVDGQTYRVAGTDHAGLNLRKRPKTTAAAVKLLPEGALVESQDRAWRQVQDPHDGSTGWAANQFVSC